MPVSPGSQTSALAAWLAWLASTANTIVPGATAPASTSAVPARVIAPGGDATRAPSGGASTVRRIPVFAGSWPSTLSRVGAGARASGLPAEPQPVESATGSSNTAATEH